MGEIEQELIDLGFSVKSIGIIYWVDAFEYIKKNQNTINIMEIYEAISKKRDNKIANVERAMRHSISYAKANIKEKFNYHKNIDNMTFIYLMRLKNKI